MPLIIIIIIIIIIGGKASQSSKGIPRVNTPGVNRVNNKHLFVSELNNAYFTRQMF